MNNNTNPIERTEITPFDVLNSRKSEEDRVLNLDGQPGGPPQNNQNQDPPVNQDPPIQDEPPVNTDTPPNEQEEEEVEYQITANLAKYAAEAMKASGKLPEDFEITDEITEEDLDKAYMSYKEEPYRNELRKEEIERLQKEEGLTPAMIEEVKLKYYGVQDEDIQSVQLFQFLSSVEFDDRAETFEQEARNFLKDYYTIKEYNPSRIDVMVDTDLNDDNIMQILADAQKDLGQKGAALYETISEKAENAKKDRAEKRAAKREKEVNLLRSGKIGDMTLNKETVEAGYRALYEKTEIVTGPDGKQYKTTLYNKLRIEAAQDPELELQHKLLLVLGKDLKQHNDITQKVTKKMMNRLNEYVQVDTKPKPGNNRPQNSPQNNQNEDNIQRVAVN